MKKLFIFFTAFLVTVHGVSQGGSTAKSESSDSWVRIGIKLGFVYSDFKMQSEWSGPHKMRFRVMGGFFANLPVNKTTFFRPELLLTGKGTTYENQFPNQIGLTYVELPLNFLYKAAASKGFFFLGGGPAPSYYIGQNPFYSGDTEVKKFDFGINVLVGYERPLGFSINLHYTHGLLNVSHEKSMIPIIKNRCFGFSLGYLF